MSAVAEALVLGPAEDAWLMGAALALGRRGLGQVWPNPAVGAIVVQPGPAGPVVVGRGWTQPGGRPHAEAEALRRAGSLARGGTMYVTLEPCSHHGKSPPCADAIMAAGIATVVSALEDPNPEVAGKGHARLRAAGIWVRTGISAPEAARVHVGHIRRMGERRPAVTLKLAVSADGKVGLAGRRPVAITAERARDRAHRLRAMHDAVLVGIGTALADDPLLTCRLPGMEQRSPVRVVADTDLRLPLEARLVATAVQCPLWVVASETASRHRETALRARGAEVLRVAHTGRKLDLRAAMRVLADKGITRVLLEGGPILATAMLASGLLDELALFRSKITVGPDGVAALEDLPLSALTHSPQFKRADTELLGPDRLDTFVRV